MYLRNKQLYIGPQNKFHEYSELVKVNIPDKIYVDRLTVDSITDYMLFRDRIITDEIHYMWDNQIEDEDAVENLDVERLKLTSTITDYLIPLTWKFKKVKKISIFDYSLDFQTEKLPPNVHTLIYDNEPDDENTEWVFPLVAPVTIVTLDTYKVLTDNITFKFIQGERLEKVYVGVYNQYDYKIAKQLMASVTVPVYITNDMNVLHDGF